MKQNHSLLSKDMETTLNVVTWQSTPSEQPKLVLQIVHGMAEYVERYEEFADFLTTQNIVVVGHDHLGHGDSVAEKNPRYGYFSKQDSPHVLVEDVYQVTQWAQNKYQGIPYFILGHSMGSFILRNYLKKYSEKVSGAIIMGTGGKRPELSLILPLLKTLNKVFPFKQNKSIDKMAFGNYGKSFPEKTSSFDWLSKNPENVQNYINDPKLGFIFTNNAFYTLFTLIKKATEKNWPTTIRKDLPILLISGEQDPVGQMGKGPRSVAQELSDDNFTDVSLQLYANLRHEILCESEKAIVSKDILNWLNAKTSYK